MLKINERQRKKLFSLKQNNTENNLRIMEYNPGRMNEKVKKPMDEVIRHPPNLKFTLL